MIHLFELHSDSSIDSTIVILSPNTSSPTCWWKIRCQRKSRKLSNGRLWLWTGRPKLSQTTCAFSQAHNACPLVSTALPQASQVGSSRIFLHYRLDFIRSKFLHAHHAKDRILSGTFRRHRVLQNMPLFWLFNGPPEDPFRVCVKGRGQLYRPSSL